MDALSRNESILIIAFFTLLSFPVLYLCRFLDNNTLTSWQWVFAGASVPRLMALLLGALAGAYLVAAKVDLLRHHRPTLILLSILAVAPLWSEPELLIDSGRYFLQAKYLAVHGLPRFLREWGGEITAWTDLPLIPALYGLLFKCFGEARSVIQACNTVLFTLTVLLTSEIGRALWNRETGFYAGLLLLGMPYLLTQVVLMLVDIPAMFFLTLSLYVFIRALREGGRWLPVAPGTILLAMAAKYSIWPMLLVLPLTAAVLQGENRRRQLARAGTIFLAAALLVGVLIGINFPLFRDQLEILFIYQRPALGLWREGFFSTFFFQTQPFISLLALWGCYRAARSGDRHFLIAAFFALMVFGLQLQRIRYLLPLLPLLTLMASCGLQAVKGEQVRRFTGLAIVSSSLVILLAGYLPFFKTTSMMNIMAAGRFLNELPGQEIEVYVLPQKTSGGNTALAIPQLDLFTSKRIVSRQIWQDLDVAPPARFAPLLFSWKIARPSFYGPGARQDGKPLVVISGGDNAQQKTHELSFLNSAPQSTKFVRQSGVFRFRTMIEVHR